jgi:hypothetical protein
VIEMPSSGAQSKGTWLWCNVLPPVGVPAQMLLACAAVHWRDAAWY